MKGTELRRLTRTAIAAHGGGHPGALLHDLYTAVLAAAVAIALGAGMVSEFAASARAIPGASLEVEWLAWATLAAVLGLSLGIAGRIGPIFLSAGHGVWWLATPVDRRGLLRPRLLGAAVLALGIGAGAGIPVAILFGTDPWSWPGAGVITAVAALNALAVGAAAWGQIRAGGDRGAGSERSRTTAIAGDGLAAGSLGLLAIGILTRAPALATRPGNLWWPIALVALAAALALVWAAETSLEQISGVHVRERGMFAAGMQGAARSLDTRELGFLLGAAAQSSPARRRSRDFRLIHAAPAALLMSEAIQLLRTPRHLTQLAIGAGLPVLAAFAGWGTWLVLIATLVGGIVSASALGGPARHAYRAPVIDTIWPLSFTAVRWWRTLLPSAAMAAWGLVVLTLIASRSLGGDENIGAWAVLGVVAGPVFAAGILRSAYRKPVDWSAPLITSPDGQAIPPGAFSVISVGPDLVVLGALPLWLAIGAFGPTPTILAVQAVTSSLALLAATRTNTKREGETP